MNADEKLRAMTGMRGWSMTVAELQAAHGSGWAFDDGSSQFASTVMHRPLTVTLGRIAARRGRLQPDVTSWSYGKDFTDFLRSVAPAVQRGESVEYRGLTLHANSTIRTQSARGCEVHFFSLADWCDILTTMTETT